MSILDDKQDPVNIPLPTGGGKVFWEEIEARGGFVLQRNVFTRHCRILNDRYIRVAWGDEGPMRAKLEELAPYRKSTGPQYGDVIGVHRIGGLYDHYGVYESDSCVYEYAARDGDFGKADIHTTTLENFVRDSNNLFILTFPERHGRPGKIPIISQAKIENVSLFGGISLKPELRNLFSCKDYHLYTPDQTIRRAKSQLGERKYNLVFNNCEHYAIWCKTGLHKSHQVESLLHFLKPTLLPLKL